MSTLPSRLLELRSGVQFHRKTFSEIGLNEGALDELVKSHGDVLADLLVENDIMEEGGRLRYLGRQFRHIDVLFAEVDDEDEPRRLVLVEDKLLKDPGAKRKVIGQIVEYAAKFQDEVRSEDLKEHFPEQEDWVNQNADLLDRQIERGDFLLIICGDSIHSNLASIVTRLAGKADRYPMSGMELCLVGMDVYERNDDQLLVPHVIGTVVRAERQLAIRVIGPNGEPLRATVESGHEASERRRKPNRSEADFFAAWATRFGDQAVLDWQAFIDEVNDAEVPGLIVSKTSVGRPTIKVRSPNVDSLLSVLRTRVSAAGIRDVCSTRTWERSETTSRAREQFRAALRAISGATVRPDGTVMLPIDKARAESRRVIDGLQQLSRFLGAE
jgi:hypothetical protein